MKLMLAGISLFVVLIALIWFLMTPNKQNPVTFKEMGVAPQVSVNAGNTAPTVDPMATSAVSSSPSSAVAAGKGPKVILKASRSQVKLSDEAGGIGPTGFTTGHNGEVYFSDRFNDRVVEITPDGRERVIYKSDPNEYIRGHGIDRDGNSFVLVGNDEFSLMKVGPNGTATRMNFTHKPEHLNGMRVDARDNAIYLVGVDSTVRVDKTTGEKSEVYGVPGHGSEEALDVVLTEEGQVMATFRSLQGAPIRTVPVGEEKFGAVLGTFALDDGNFVVAFESDPSLSEENANNPQITIKKLNPNGEPIGSIQIPSNITEDTFSIDQPLNVTKDGKIQQAVARPDGTEVLEYELP